MQLLSLWAGATQSAASLAPQLPWPGVGNQRISQLRGVLHPSQHKQAPLQKVLRFLVHPSPTTVTAKSLDLGHTGLHTVGFCCRFISWADTSASLLTMASYPLLLGSSLLTLLTGPKTDIQFTLSDIVPAKVTSPGHSIHCSNSACLSNRCTQQSKMSSSFLLSW